VVLQCGRAQRSLARVSRHSRLRKQGLLRSTCCINTITVRHGHAFDSVRHPLINNSTIFQTRNTFYGTCICSLLFPFHPIYHDTIFEIIEAKMLRPRSGTVQGHPRSKVTVPIDSLLAVSCSTSVHTIIVSLTIFEIFDVKRIFPK